MDKVEKRREEKKGEKRKEPNTLSQRATKVKNLN
jgi:hypothetical protein